MILFMHIIHNHFSVIVKCYPQRGDS